ncbi:MAG TPA: DUF6585 family protein [Candidatus Angelobacter sp.]|nr:DUF6585 family protein [Candidatus Angelobacter sp.]
MFPSPAQHTFKYTLVWAIAAAVLFLPLLGWALYDLSQRHAFEPVLWFFAGLFGLLFAFAWIWTRTQVTIHGEGISYKSLFKEEDLRWEEIKETRYSQQPVNVSIHFGLIGLLIAALARSKDKMVRSLQVIGPRSITIGSNIRKGSDAAQLVLARVNPRLRQDLDRVLNAGGTVSFGKISLSPQGIIWKAKEPIPYNTVGKCRIDGAILRIKAEGKWLDNIAIGVKKVPNVFIFLDMVEEKRQAHAPMSAMAGAGSSASQYL